MPEPDFSQRRIARFDPTINLGHILTGAATIVTMGTAIATVYLNLKIAQADSSARISQNEKAVERLDKSFAAMLDQQQQITLTQQKLSLTLEYLAKQKQ